ncbi:voltage-gated protein/chloride channel-like protein [Venturia nashicola]|nr:voltage-gated protein/chloride channel-like protein [Venturia nashicola]
MDAFRVKALQARKGWHGRVERLYDGSQGWILVAIIGFLTACLAYFVNVTERILFDYKAGYCSYSWALDVKACCDGIRACDEWKRWSDVIRPGKSDALGVEYMFHVFLTVLMAEASCFLTLLTKTVVPSNVRLSTLDEDLAAERQVSENGEDDEVDEDDLKTPRPHSEKPGDMTYYSAAGSGVAEIKVIISGFVLHGYLGLKTLVIKTLALILSIASGLSVGKEGPYVHISTAIGNIACRLFPKYNLNDGKRREVLSASAAAGVAVAFGSPLGGVLFSLEEVSYYFPNKTLFRTFFCTMVAALTLKFLNPYGNSQIVLFEVRYITGWQGFEMVAFVLLGILGGLMGALFIKATKFWATTFRRVPFFKKHPVAEVALIAAVTGLLGFWNRYTRLPVTELLRELASPCDTFTASGTGLCPTQEQIPAVLWYLLVAFVLKGFLTTITFGIKVPAGIYVPSMVVGGLLGRIVGHIVQYLALNYSHTGLFGDCKADSAPEDCVVPGVYAMVAAGATMCGVTRLSITLGVILLELTGSYDHVLPFSIGILVAKWTADAVEPLSIYDMLIQMNNYPFLDKQKPIFTGELGDIVPKHINHHRIIDLSQSPFVHAKTLRAQLDYLHSHGEIDGGLPLLKNGVLVGLIPAPDLEWSLDQLNNESNSLCLMSTQVRWNRPIDSDDENEPEDDPTDFTSCVDATPVALDAHSSMDLAYEIFVKLGLRYVCVLRGGKYAGLVHKKNFVKFCKDLEHTHSV